MMRALYTAASGMTAQELNLDNIANNLANSSTAGFRSRRLQFEDLIYQNLIMPGAAATQQTTVVAGLQVGLGTRSAASEVIQTQGDFSQTGNPLDLTIQGQGFFQVLLPNGQTAYTRAGSFHPDGQGNLVDQDGDAVQPAITIPTGATSVTVGSDGTVSVTLAGQTAAQQVGTMQLALFNNPGGLNSTGSNLFLADHRVGRSDRRDARRQRRLGQHRAGDAGAVERERGDGIREHDRGATLVRSQFARGECGGPDAADHQQSWAVADVEAQVS